MDLLLSFLDALLPLALAAAAIAVGLWGGFRIAGRALYGRDDSEFP